MAADSKAWENYEQVAVFLLNEVASQLGLERVEGKQGVYGSHSSTSWEIDGKAVKIGNEGFLIVECRRQTTSKQSQAKVASLAYSIQDVGASGGILISPMGFQKGAKKVAATENIHEVFLGPDSTTEDYLLRFLNKVFAGVSDIAHLTDSAIVTVTHGDGTVESRTA